MSTQWRSALSQAMIEDLRVIIVASSAKKATEMFDEMRGYVPPASDAHISRVNGRQKIEFPPGGRVRFSSGKSLRGASADKLYLSKDVARHLYKDDVDEVVMTSRFPEVILF